MTSSPSAYRKHLLETVMLLVCSALLSGCACLGGTAPPAEVYTLEYPSPVFTGRQPAQELIRVGRFAPVEAFAVTTMIASPSPRKREVYPDAWWSVHPGALVTDFLIRDMRRSGLFHGVFTYRDDTDARYLLGGTVEEFLEEGGSGGPAAVIGLTASLQDQTARKDPSKGVAFQKSYREREPMTARSPQALAAAMSAAMERLSRAIQNDVAETIQGRTPAN